MLTSWPLCVAVRKSFKVLKIGSSVKLFKMSEVEDRIKRWSDRWEEGSTGWHKEDVNTMLLNHADKLLMGPELNVLLPLCGKTIDMKWLYDKGHKVTGIEGVEKPIIEFFTEHGILYQKEVLPWGTLYKSDDGNLKIYHSDLFDVEPSHLGKFDAVWDRGSLVAIFENDRESYAALLKSLVKPKFHYLLSVMQYEPTATFSGPPRNVPPSLVAELFGDVSNQEVLEEYDMSAEEKVLTRWGLTQCSEVVLLLKSK
ncbi:putative thiopurine S-methyltransferase isoform X2 [Oratosquilla oratoria]|uniref:putative thiopurine S-methyltransferase isoform X2 n=1 Tax=Oratosquilla oratoria TaxID=337810 RepID=UPI003F768B41